MRAWCLGPDVNKESGFPLVTFVLLAYNQENYVQEAVESALAQDYPNLEIIVSDDASTDGTWRVVEDCIRAYSGPHDIVLNRNPKNLGIGRHVSRIGRRARGELVILAAADDVSDPTRATVLVDAWREKGRGPAVVFSDVSPVDAQSREVRDWNETVFTGHQGIEDMARGTVRVLGASTAYTSSVFSEFDDMAAYVGHEDRVLPFRALLLGGKVVHVPEKLVRYRIEGGVSRNFPRSRSEYLQKVAAIEDRRARDAVQRLVDARQVPDVSPSVLQQCVQRVVDHFCLMGLARAGSAYYEVEVIRGIAKGGSLLLLLKLYAKLRLRTLMEN